MRRWIALLIVVAACGGAEPVVTSAATAVATTPAPSGIVVPRQLEDLDVVSVDLGDRELVVAVAETSRQRRTGLMFVTDLDDLDGMLFVFPEDTTTVFWMENTLIPLDIAFFAGDGTFVSKTTMDPCETSDCPRYSADGPFRYAIEVARGDFDWLTRGSALGVRLSDG